MGMTMAEKILARTAGKPAVKPGEYVDCKLDGIVAMQGSKQVPRDTPPVAS